MITCKINAISWNKQEIFNFIKKNDINDTDK